MVSARVGYAHETFMYTQELVTGKIFEYDKNGIFLSIAGAF
jgi:DNA-directed RNA polymerase subunit E'/Rpb7